MKRFVRPVTLLPILVGVAVCVWLFVLGDADDAPGLSLIGLVIGFLLVMWGIYNSGIMKKSYFEPILLLCFGVGGILFSVVLLLDSEFEESQGMLLIGTALGVILVAIGMIKIRKLQKRKDDFK